MIESVEKGEIFSGLGDRILRNYIISGKIDDLRKLLFQK